MKFNFSKNLENFLKIILKNTQGKRVFFVGGVVRDNILNIPTQDVDLLIEGSALELTLPPQIEIKSIHKDFATLKAVYQDIEIDIASTRVESYPTSGGLPVVEQVGVSIEEDVKRRDFSINSLYCELKLINNEIQYNLIDLVEGVSDINNKTIRVLHDKSYIDDPTRILRGVGFKHRFGFDFSSHDKNLINEYMKNITYQGSYDRIKSVFKKVIQDENIFREIIEKKYYKILSDKELSIDFNKIKNIDKDAYILIIEDKEVEPLSNSSYISLFKEFCSYSKAQLDYYFYKTNDDNINLYLKNKDLKLHTTGSDLMDLGYKQGRIYSEILEALFKEKLFGNIASKEDEINWIKQKFPQK